MKTIKEYPDKDVIDIVKKNNHNYNLSVEELIAYSIKHKEGIITSNGSLAVNTGRYTGRSPDDRFIVYDDETHNTIDWGKINHEFPPGKFEKIFDKMKEFAKKQELFIFDGFVGADYDTRLPIRIINDSAWQNLVVRHLFINLNKEEGYNHEPEFTILCLNNFQLVPEIDGTRTNTAIIINFSKKLILIANTRYAGEIKKALFSVMNFLLPERKILPMHCSANVGDNGDVALFFGLSGTGKTTLSADPNRRIIGDDEHGWSDKGIFNFEGGFYVKCINLSQEAEPEIWNAIKHGTVLENVILDGNKPDYDDNRLTENARASYPLNYVPASVIPSVGTHPKVIFFLVADALGVLPPISRLTKEGAMFYFLSGYTSKLAGTERGIREPKTVFSECFGAPFMPRPASVYAKLLGEKINQHNTVVYLVNTGWTGGPYKVGNRIKIKYSRAIITAALTGELNSTTYRHDDLFNLDVPTKIFGVPDEILNPRETWLDKKEYDHYAKKLAMMFTENFKKFKNINPKIIDSGPNYQI
ncbi:phosphoenolpyruvate carboxykinase (ATP) [Nitrosopumilus sp.]|uniref:phosphoenolpyruvate carboxykinase (ATP) n=1 Tax=Nitrosopumilus sp. TaxID=2024843 RepID=UPI003B5B09A7